MDTQLPAIPFDFVANIVNTLNNFVMEHRTFHKDTYVRYGDPFTCTAYEDGYTVEWYGLKLLGVNNSAIKQDATEKDALDFAKLLLGCLADMAECAKDTIAAITQEGAQSEQV